MFRKKKNKDKEKKKFNETKLGIFASKVVKQIPSLAGDILKVATSPNPLGATLSILKEKLTGVSEHPTGIDKNKADALLIEFEKNRMDFESEVYELEVRDRESARDMYENTDHKTADYISKRIIKLNLPIILALILVNVGSVWLLEGKGEIIAIISNFIGIAIGHLFNERQSIINFFFGSSRGSKDKSKLLKE